VLVLGLGLEDGTVVDESQAIVAWAEANPAQRGGIAADSPA
jgi:hypothetical protein